MSTPSADEPCTKMPRYTRANSNSIVSLYVFQIAPQIESNPWITKCVPVGQTTLTQLRVTKGTSKCSPGKALRSTVINMPPRMGRESYNNSAKVKAPTNSKC